MEYLNSVGSNPEPKPVVEEIAILETKFFATDILIPLLLIAFVIIVNVVNESAISILGVLVAVPLISAIFGSPRIVAMISLTSLLVTGWLIARGHEDSSSVSNIIFLLVASSSVLAINAANRRIRKESSLVEVMRSVAEMEALEKVATTDWLTGALNRRGVVQAIEDSSDEFHSVAMFDIDGLKKVNDSLGHVIGDQYVKNVTSRISANLKAGDIFGRWGGDEFIAVLPLDEEQATEVINRVITEVHRSPIVWDGVEIEARVSAGIAPWSKSQTIDQVLTLADQALYAAKARGGTQALSLSQIEHETE